MFVQNGERHRAAADQPFVKLPDVESLAELLLRFFAQVDHLQHSEFVAEGLGGDIDAVAETLGADLGL